VAVLFSARGLPQQAQALDGRAPIGALTASGKSSSEGLREILTFWVSHRFVAAIVHDQIFPSAYIESQVETSTNRLTSTIEKLLMLA